MTDDPSSSATIGDDGAPRWVTVFLVGFLLLLILLAVVVILTGGHGPGAHTP